MADSLVSPFAFNLTFVKFSGSMRLVLGKLHIESATICSKWNAMRLTLAPAVDSDGEEMRRLASLPDLGF